MVNPKKLKKKVHSGRVCKPSNNEKFNSDQIVKFSEPIFNSYILSLYRNKKYSLCISFIERNLSEEQKKEPHNRILLAASHIMLSNYKEAHIILDSVIAANSNNAFAYYNKGVAFYFEKKFRWSNVMLDMAIEADPSSQMDRARDMKVRVDLESRRAVIVLEKLSMDDIKKNMKVDLEDMKEEKRTEKTPTKEFNESKLYSMLTDKTIPKIPEALPKSFVPISSDDYYKKGKELYMSGSLQKALSSFLKSHELDPDYVEVEKMIEKIQKLINFATTSKTKLDEKEFEEVVKVTSAALALGIESNFTSRTFYYQRGIALHYLGRKEESIRDYENIEKINKILGDVSS